MSDKKSNFARIITFFASVFVAISFVAFGLFVCIGFPQITGSLSSSYGTWEKSPFSQEQISEAAVVTFDYTVGSHSKDVLYRMLYSINTEASDTTGYETYGHPPNFQEPLDLEEPLTGDSFSHVSEEYVLTEEAISHLDDVYEVVTLAKKILALIALVGVSLMLYLGFRFGSQWVSKVLVFSGITVIALFILFAVWVLIDFNSFFRIFHSLFFEEGSWTFPADSLLITMYPTNFWISMGGIWLASTLVCCIVSVVIGIVVRKRHNTITHKKA